MDRLGSVHGDGEPFLLWLDHKSGEEELVLELRRLLARYPMLARMDGGKMKRAAVTVILTGDEDGKRAYTAGAGAPATQNPPYAENRVCFCISETEPR